jgi:hypothetical protein
MKRFGSILLIILFALCLSALNLASPVIASDYGDDGYGQEMKLLEKRYKAEKEQLKDRYEAEKKALKKKYRKSGYDDDDYSHKRGKYKSDDDYDDDDYDDDDDYKGDKKKKGKSKGK